MKKLHFLLPALLTAALFTSCFSDDDGGNGNGDYPSYIAMTTVHERAEIKPGYYFTLDNGKTIYPGDTGRVGVYDTRDKEGKRAIVYFNFIEQAMTGYDYNAALYQITDVLTKVVETASTEEELKAFGNDPTRVEGAWISGGFLNINYFIPTNGTGTTKHRISLVENKTAPEGGESGEYTTLEFRHNADGDLSGSLARSYVSFKLNDYNPAVTGKKGINLKTTDINGFTSYIKLEPLKSE